MREIEENHSRIMQKTKITMKRNRTLVKKCKERVVELERKPWQTRKDQKNIAF